MYKTEIVSKLKPLIERPEVCGFEAFLVSRTEPRLKKLNSGNKGTISCRRCDLH